MSSERQTESLGRRAVRDVAPEPALGAGDEVGPWRIEGLIAVGGCGAVFRARHRVLGREAAVKVLHHDLSQRPEMVVRFIQEARAVNLIRHPGIVDIFDIGELPDGRPYFAMELLAADNLEDRVEACERLTLAEVAAVVAQLVPALAAAHERGFVHRDVKPRNVGFSATAGGTESLKLLDFGVAKLIEPGPDGTVAPTQRVGTPQSMAPEQIRGEPVSAATDVYGLGVMLFYLLSGTYPFEAIEAAEIERMHLEDEAPRLAERIQVPPAIDDLIAATLAKAAAARPTLVQIAAGFAVADPLAAADHAASG